jgi:hypothetical protein
VSAYNALMAMRNDDGAHTCRVVDNTRWPRIGEEVNGIHPAASELYTNVGKNRALYR